jgi:hypothetical protein
LKELTEHVLVFEQTRDSDFKRFIDWVTASVLSQSRAVEMATTTDRISLAKTDEEILTLIKETAAMEPIDPDSVILTGRCQRSRLPYLMKYDRIDLPEEIKRYAPTDRYALSGCYPLDESYFEWSDVSAPSDQVNTNLLEGAPWCPHCGNPYAFAMCGCGKLMCVDGLGPAICPWCGKDCHFGEGGDQDFDVNRAQG